MLLDNFVNAKVDKTTRNDVDTLSLKQDISTYHTLVEKRPLNFTKTLKSRNSLQDIWKFSPNPKLMMFGRDS
jgi:hypothetical protein